MVLSIYKKVDSTILIYKKEFAREGILGTSEDQKIYTVIWYIYR